MGPWNPRERSPTLTRELEASLLHPFGRDTLDGALGRTRLGAVPLGSVWSYDVAVSYSIVQNGSSGVKGGSGVEIINC